MISPQVSELGGVPLMLRSSDMSATIPDEKVVITYVSYLCGRLLDLRLDCRAARVIQHWWRKYRVKRSRGELKVVYLTRHGFTSFFLATL